MLKFLKNAFIYLIIGILLKNGHCKDTTNLKSDTNNNSDNNNNNLDNNDDQSYLGSSSLSSSAINNLSWDCANNSTCIQNIARNLLSNYENGQNIDFGLFSIEKLSKISNSDNSNINSGKEKDTKGRSLSTFQEIIEGNAIKIPIGPMVFSVQRSEEDPDYMELALSKQINEKEQGTLKGRGRGGGFGGGLLKKKRGHKQKKHLQVFIPLYLAANTFGWTLLAVKAVGVLTLKALIVSKLAFLIAAGIIAKKMMDSAQQKMLFPQHHPYLMPYNMDYGLQAHSMPGAEEYLNLHLANQQALENMAAAETNHVVHALQANGTQPQLLGLQGLNGNAQKIKRSDQWSGVQPSRSSSPLYNYLTKSPASSPYAYQQ